MPLEYERCRAVCSTTSHGSAGAVGLMRSVDLHAAVAANPVERKRKSCVGVDCRMWAPTSDQRFALSPTDFLARISSHRSLYFAHWGTMPVLLQTHGLADGVERRGSSSEAEQPRHKTYIRII